MPRHRIDPGIEREFLGGDLVSHRGNGFFTRANKGDARLIQRIGKGLILGQETVSGMNGFRTGLFAGIDNLLNDEITFRSSSRADMNRLIRHLHMHGAVIGVGINGDSLDTHGAR